ncbi:uncharacterized protein LOC128278515 [Anopheles cruzii]|uniref:uncharacterized protein LOC128278515 n=1 Tax=Anopheles cruzii TaxID=68878 RepID=UPI0022EC31C4|nr:uncharacterized protein LOC128278515 [Anopheles cruzii]
METGCTALILCGVVVITCTALVPEQPSAWPRWSPELGKQLELVFAAVDRIDVVNSNPDATNDPALGALLRYKTVRWYTADPMPSECTDGATLLGDERLQERMQWLWNDGGGYLIYGDLSALLGEYVCLFDPGATYLLTSQNRHLADGIERPQLLCALRLIWAKRGAFRVFVHQDGAILTYNPFVQSRANDGDGASADGCVSNFGALVEVSASEPLPHVPWNDFHGYPVKIEVFRSVYSNPVKGSTDSYRGADITARDVFQHHLNVTVIHVPADSDLFGDRLPNGTFTGAIGRVVRHQTDIVFTGFFIKDYLARDLAFTASLYSDAVCCLVRKASRIPEYLLPLFIFPADIWAMLCLLGVFCSLTWIALRATVRRSLPAHERRFWSRRYRFAVLFNLPRTLRDASRRRQALQLVIDTFILLVSAPYRRFTRAGTERLFLTGLLLVSLIFVSLYQSGLAAVFVHPLYRRDIGSLAQLDDSGMAIPVKYRGFIDDVFPVNYSRLMDSLRGRMVHLQVQESMLTRVARLGNIATVTRKTSLALDNAVYMTTRQLHMIPECPRTYNLAYVMHRQSVFGECFNRVLLRMVGGGLVSHWIDQMRYEWTLHNRRVVQNMMVSDFKVLTVLDMQFAFYVLAIGLSIAVGVIAGEVLYCRALQREHHLHHHRRK